MWSRSYKHVLLLHASVENPLLLANKFNEFYANVGIITALKAAKLAEEHNFNIHDKEGFWSVRI